MQDKPDHLIERAAALLRSTTPARLPENPLVRPDIQARPSPPSQDHLRSAVPPLLVPPPSRPAPTFSSAPASDRVAPTQPHAEKPAPSGIAQGSASLPTVALDALERAGLVVARTKRTRISEEYRIVIGRVLRAMHDEPEGQGEHNVVLVTSARPGEGKSFTALNIAASIVQNASESVLLVDVDPKLRSLSDQLRLNEHRGFLDLSADPSLSPDELILATAVPNLTVLPVGSRLGNTAISPSEGGGVNHDAPTIARLARRFPKSIILIDAPPCLSTSDPHTLASQVGQVIMVVEAERTQRSEVEAALDLVRVCPTITILLNKVQLTSSHTFGAYDYFGSYS